MSIASIASSLFSSATTALGMANPAAAPFSRPSTQPNGSTPSNNPTGSTNPFQSLSPDLQAWLTQNQASGGAQPHHHHQHGAGTSGSQQAGQSNANPFVTTATAAA